MVLNHDRNRSTWVRKYGINLDVDGAEDIIAAGGDQTWPTSVVAAADIDIVSSSAEDGAGTFTGALALWIEGLDENWKSQSEAVDLLGLVDAHPTKDYIRIHRAKVLAVGSGGKNLGNITIDINGAQTLAYIPATYGQTQQATYTIPKNWKYGWIRDFAVNMVGSDTPSSDTANGTLEVRDAPGQSWRVIENWSVSRDKKDGSAPPEKWPGERLPAGADIRLRVLAVSSANEIIKGSIFIELEG